MSYAAAADIDRLYPGKLDLIAAELVDGAPVRNDAQIAQALADATGTINSYVAARYPLPLSTLPAVLVPHCVDIAVWRLASTADLLTDEIGKRAEMALAWLKDLAAGRAALDLPKSAPEAVAPDLPVLDAPERLFRRRRIARADVD